MFWNKFQVMHMCCDGASRATLTMRSLSSSLTPRQGKITGEVPVLMYQCVLMGCIVMVQE